MSNLVPASHVTNTGYKVHLCRLDKRTGETGCYLYHPDRPDQSIPCSRVYTRVSELIDMLYGIDCRIGQHDNCVYWVHP